MVAQMIPPPAKENITITTNGTWDLANITNPPLKYCPNYANVPDQSTYVYYEEAQSISWMW